MTLSRSKDLDALCYPFIYEQGYLCDYEVVTDELCSQVGYILAAMDDCLAEVKADLSRLQPMIYHLNGSIRGRLAIHQVDLDWLKARYQYYRAQLQEQLGGFILPRGNDLAMRCHLARSGAKKAIRLMLRIDQEGIPVADELHHFCNLLCNYFFVLAVYINKANGYEELPFVSLSYSNPLAGGK